MPGKATQPPIHLAGEFYLGRDRYNWILQERYVSQSGKTKGQIRYRDIGSYGTLADLANGLADLLGRSTPSHDLISLIRALGRLAEAIRMQVERAADAGAVVEILKVAALSNREVRGEFCPECDSQTEGEQA